MGRIKGQQAKGKRIKTPESSAKAPEPIYNKHPSFSFRYMHRTYSLSACTLQEKADLANTLSQLSLMTWGEIANAPSHGLGQETLAQTAINVGMPAIISGDVKLYALRFSGLKPMVGFKEGAIFQIVWLDRAFEVYDHGS